jgi:bifunctional non-homologous end joining protein LigD
VSRTGVTAIPSMPAAPAATASAVSTLSIEARRLEQHFVYNALSTIASLIRTDPARARELLLGFADLSRAADQAGVSTLGRELAAVQDYLRLEQARFGARLQVALDVDPSLHAIPVAPMQVLAAVRETVQRGIEPRPEGGLLSLVAREAPGGCEVRVTGGDAEPTTLLLETRCGLHR